MTRRGLVMRPFRLFPFGLAVAVGALACADARASYPLPFWSFVKVSPGDGYVFVLIGEKERSAIGGFTEPDDARAVRARYPRTGLYRNDGSTDPLWSFDGHFYQHEVEVAPDGVHLIVCRRSSGSPDAHVLGFYANGRLLRSYQLRSLADFATRSDHGPDETAAVWVKETRFDDARMEYELETTDGSRFVFDARSGRIVSARGLARLWLVTLGLLVAVLLLRKAPGVGGWWERQRAAGRLPHPVVTIPAAFAGLLCAVWGASLGQLPPWGWLVIALVLGGFGVLFAGLLRWRPPLARPPADGA